MRVNISIDEELKKEADKVRQAERPILTFSAFVRKALWDKIKEKEQATKQQEEKK